MTTKMTDTSFEATVVQTQRLTPEQSPEEVREINIMVDSAMDLSSGCNVGVLVPGPHPFGNDKHERLYTITDISREGDNIQASLCVRRCTYIDEISGEEYKGIASNFLCDRNPGDVINLAGPYGNPFTLPEDDDANLVLIAQGTGIAPFRALVKDIYESGKDWKGKVQLYYGARSGLEMVYMNEQKNAFMHFYDQKSFKAFEAVSPRPHLDDPVALDKLLKEQAESLWPLIRNPDTHVYVAGTQTMWPNLEKAFIEMAGSPEKWTRTLAELKAGHRWQELLY